MANAGLIYGKRWINFSANKFCFTFGTTLVYSILMNFDLNTYITIIKIKDQMIDETNNKKTK